MDRIKNAIFGIILLLGAYFVLYTIDPRLTSLKNPNLPLLPHFRRKHRGDSGIRLQGQ